MEFELFCIRRTCPVSWFFSVLVFDEFCPNWEYPRKAKSHQSYTICVFVFRWGMENSVFIAIKRARVYLPSCKLSCEDASCGYFPPRLKPV